MSVGIHFPHLVCSHSVLLLFASTFPPQYFGYKTGHFLFSLCRDCASILILFARPGLPSLSVRFWPVYHWIYLFSGFDPCLHHNSHKPLCNNIVIKPLNCFDCLYLIHFPSFLFLYTFSHN